MVKLKINSKNQELYEFQNNFGKNYLMNLEFLDIENIPNVGDIIYFQKSFLDKYFKDAIYIFGSMQNKYGKPNELVELRNLT